MDKIPSSLNLFLLCSPNCCCPLCSQITCSPACFAWTAVSDLSSPLACSLGLSHCTTHSANYLHALPAQKKEVGPRRKKREGRSARGGVCLLSDWPCTNISLSLPLFSFKFSNLPLHISYSTNENKHSSPASTLFLFCLFLHYFPFSFATAGSVASFHSTALPLYRVCLERE